jgi:hypothetical protein
VEAVVEQVKRQLAAAADCWGVFLVHREDLLVNC